MVYYSALHWAKKAEKSAEKCEQIQEDLRNSGLDLSDYAKKGEVVHNTGDETIDGVKTFNNGVFFNSAVAFVKNTANTASTYQDVNYIRDKSLETNNIPYDKTYYTNALMDKNNKFVTYIQNTHKADGTSTMSISARTQNANGENVTSSIIVSAEKNGNVSATAPVPTASSSMDSKQISTVGWVNDPTKSTNVVHRTGNETIDGIKKFTNAPYLSIGGFREIIDIDKGTAPTSGIYAFDSIFYDKNGTLQKHKIAQKYTYIQKNGAVANITSVLKPEAGSEEAVSMGIGYNEKGEGYSTTVMPIASSSTTATNIATTGWVNDPTKSTNVVHRSHNETIDGVKTFKSLGSGVQVLCTHVDSTTTPASNQYNAIVVSKDKNGKATGCFRNPYYSNGRISAEIQVSREVNGVAYYKEMGIGFDADGTCRTSAPTPPAGDNSTQIATTEWVNSFISSIVNTSTKDSGYVKINGLIIQWGQVTGLTAVGTSSKTVTLPTAFTSTNYRLSITSNYSSRTQNSATAIDTTIPRTTTAFTFHSSYAESVDWIAIGY